VKYESAQRSFAVWSVFDRPMLKASCRTTAFSKVRQRKQAVDTSSTGRFCNMWGSHSDAAED